MQCLITYVNVLCISHASTTVNWWLNDLSWLILFVFVCLKIFFKCPARTYYEKKKRASRSFLWSLQKKNFFFFNGTIDVWPCDWHLHSKKNHSKERLCEYERKRKKIIIIEDAKEAEKLSTFFASVCGCAYSLFA